MKELAGWAASSANPQDVSSRVKGVVLALSSVIIFIAARFFDITFTPEDIVELATVISGIAGVTVSLYGAGLALIRFIAARRN